MDPGAFQAAQILSSFKFDDFFTPKMTSSASEPLTFAPGDIQYILTPHPLTAEVQVIHAPSHQMYVQQLNH